MKIGVRRMFGTRIIHTQDLVEVDSFSALLTEFSTFDSLLFEFKLYGSRNNFFGGSAERYNPPGVTTDGFLFFGTSAAAATSLYAGLELGRVTGKRGLVDPPF